MPRKATSRSRVDDGYAEAAKALHTRRETRRQDRRHRLRHRRQARARGRHCRRRRLRRDLLRRGHRRLPRQGRRAGPPGHVPLRRPRRRGLRPAPRRASPPSRPSSIAASRPASPRRTEFDKSSFNLAYTRTLELLRRVLGPRYDLDKIWDRHTELEFATRDADETMTTMVAEPYVNHVPVMTGGTGYDETLRFYKHHFIPTDAEGRRAGADQPHDRRRPRRRRDAVLLHPRHRDRLDAARASSRPASTSRFRWSRSSASAATRSISEHIYWDQASVLVQVGLLDPKLYRSPASRPRGRPSTRTSRRTR